MHDLSYSSQQIFYTCAIFYKITPIFYNKLRIFYDFPMFWRVSVGVSPNASR